MSTTTDGGEITEEELKRNLRLRKLEEEELENSKIAT